MLGQKDSLYAGVDLHKEFMHITVVDSEGYIQKVSQINNTEVDKVESLFKTYSIKQELVVTVESTNGWYWFADLLAPIPNVRLKLGHPLGIKALTCTNKKTDARDSKLLADLTRSNLLPESHLTTQVSRELKEFVRHRMDLVESRSNIKRRINATLLKQNLHCPYTNVLGIKSIDWMNKQNMKYQYRFEIDSNITLAESINEQIDKTNDILKEMSVGIKDLDLLQTIPGIGLYSALVLYIEIDDIHRFPKPSHLCAYAGIVPKVISSGGKTTMGKSGFGNKYMRTVLAESVIHTIRKDPRIKQRYELLVQKKNKGIAKMSCMQKLLTSVYFVLKNQEEYRVTTVEQTL